MPVEEDIYVNIDCLDTQTGKAIPLPKEEKRKISAEKLAENRNNFFMKIWTPISKIVMIIWKYILQVLHFIGKYVKKVWTVLKNKYYQFKTRQEKNK